MSETVDSTGLCPTCGQPLRHGHEISEESRELIARTGNPGVTFDIQGQCENEACADFGREFGPDEWLRPASP